MNGKQNLILIGILLLLSNCKNNPYDSSFEQNFELIKENSIKKNDINWSDLKRKVLDSIKHFYSDDDVYNAISLTIKLIDDGHSLFIRPNTPSKFDFHVKSVPIPVVESKIVNGDIGYIKVPEFLANDSLCHLFALEVRKSLLDLDATTQLSGWIVDLRGNGGGKSSTMLLAVSPLFTDSLIGYTLNNANKFEELYCSNHFSMNGMVGDSLIYKSQLKNRNIKIAVLVNKKTASAGELLAIALRAQNKSQVIGEKTKGKTSHLRLYTYKKGNAKLLLATMRYCDNKKNVFKSSITPDVKCSEVESVSLAIKWIKE